jgi:DNA polymerase III alpha subunit
MSDFVDKRSLLINNIENLLENISSRREAKKNDADDLFGFDDSVDSSLHLQIPAQNKAKIELLMMEKEILGLYVSGNPLAEYRELQNWLRDLVDEPNLHLILVEKIKKIFTRNNLMMLGMNITTPSEQLEGIVFPKLAPELSPILSEKSLFWVKGPIKEPEQKKKEVEDGEGDVKEFVESKKIIFEVVSPFEDGIMKLIAGQTITLSTKNTLEQIDWKALLLNPKNIVAKKAVDSRNQKEVELRLSSQFGIEKIKEIKSKLKKQPDHGDVKVSVWVEHLGEFKKVAGDFWLEESYYLSLR